uniref:Uncharacterized protein n=1 Tax=Arundo donax TaxID=35708 RepID=A0A0A9C654_ARUDO
MTLSQQIQYHFFPQTCDGFPLHTFVVHVASAGSTSFLGIKLL